MLQTQKFIGQTITFRRAMLAHLQGISPSAKGTPCQLKKNDLAKNAFMFISVSVVLFALVYRLCFSRVRDFFYSLSEMEVGHIL